jgi:hypothetical protein
VRAASYLENAVEAARAFEKLDWALAIFLIVAKCILRVVERADHSRASLPYVDFKTRAGREMIA